MSIPVDVARLAESLAPFDWCYLLTTSADGRVKAVSVRAELDGDDLVVGQPGRGSLANVQLNRAVTLLYPPIGDGPHSLLVDGLATVADAQVRLSPTSAVLHANTV